MVNVSHSLQPVGCPGSHKMLVLTSSHIRTLFLSFFGSLFLSSNHHHRWGGAPNARCCVGQELPSIRSERLMDQYPLEPIVLSFLEELQRPRKAAESHCAAVALQPLTGPSSPSAMTSFLGPHSRARVPVQPSNCCLLPSGLPPRTRLDSCPRIAEGRTAADAGRDLHPQRGRALCTEPLACRPR